MKKAWVNPEILNLAVEHTESSANITNKIDAQRTDDNGNLWTSYS